MGPSFAGGGPGAAHFARSGINNKTTKGVTGDLTRPWAVGPANFSVFILGIIICVFIQLIHIIRRANGPSAC